MNDFNVDKYLDIANEEKKKRNLTNYIPLYPMFRVENEKLYIGILFTEEKENVWDKEKQIKPEYWALIDINNDKVIEFNKTSEKDFVIGNMITKNLNNQQKEISKYTIEKTLQYKNYLIEDIKTGQTPLQKKLSSVLGNEMYIDGEKVNINDYLLSNIEESIKTKVNELVDLLVQSKKYGSIMFYYHSLFTQIIDEYNKDKTIDKDKLKLCIEIMNNYYDSIIGIDNFLNLN